MGALGVFFTIVGLLEGGRQRRIAAGERARQAAAEREIAKTKQRREKRNQLRQARAQRAAIVAQGVGQGGAAQDPSSAVSGATAGVESQYAYNLSFLDTVSAQNTRAFEASTAARSAEGRAREAQAISSTASSFSRG